MLHISPKSSPGTYVSIHISPKGSPDAGASELMESFGSLSAIKNTVIKDHETWESTAVETEEMEGISEYIVC